MDTQIVPRQTITAVIAKRGAAFEALTQAHVATVAAQEAKAHASNLADQASNFMKSTHVPGDFRYNRTKSEDVAPLDEYLATWRRIIDADIWENIILLTGIEGLMDKTARKKFREEMQTNPPEITEENVRATLEGLTMDADMIFKRSIATVFTSLDRRFRSHNAWKIGSRIIFENAFDEWGSWNYHRDRQSDLRDIERIFFVLDGQKAPDQWHGICEEVNKVRGQHGGARQGHIETEFFRIRTFKNGNCHVWFERDDLVEKANKLIAEYYGDVIPDDATEIDESGLNEPKRTMAKNFGFFPSPEDVVNKLLYTAEIYQREGSPRIRVLEPSAGTGNIAYRIAGEGHAVDCVEVQADHAEALARSKKFARVWHNDFLDLTPELTGKFDFIVMNPPFDRGRDIDHVMHATKFLNERGRLVSVMHAGTEFSMTKKAVAFRKYLKSKGTRLYDLPANSFSSVGTNCNTVYVEIKAWGTPSRW